MSQPRFVNDDAFRALRMGEVDAFHRMTADRERIDFSDADFRGTDFRKVNVAKLVLQGAYLKDADLRGLDLRGHDLEGCSLHNAKIGGTYFPVALTAAEIQMSVHHGTRLRMGV